MIYESLLATKKIREIREIREIRVRLKRIILSVEHESFETTYSCNSCNSCLVKSMRNSRAEKYLLLRSLVRTVAATRVSVQIRELKIGGRREIFPPDPLTSGK